MNRFMLVLVIALLASGCSGDGASTANTSTSEGDRDAATTEPPPRPEGDLPVVIDSDPLAGVDALEVHDRVDEALPLAIPATSVEDILVELRRETILMSGLWADTTASCGALQIQAGASATCTVTYAGLPVEWRVSFADEPVLVGGSRFEYHIAPQSLVLRADYVYRAAWLEFGGEGTDELRCDQIPNVYVAPHPRSPTHLRGYDTGFDCQVLEEGAAAWDTLSIYATQDNYSIDLYRD